MQSEANKKRKARTKSSEIMNQRKYECHCGRKYLSYSALYIHSKQKHGITITTKAYDNRYDAQASPVPSKIKFVNSEAQPPQQLYSHNPISPLKEGQNIERTILHFVNMQGKGNSKQNQFLFWIFQQLIICTNSNTNLLENYLHPMNYTQKNSPALIPLIFNFFLVDYCPKTLGPMYDVNKEKMRESVYKFGEWLYKNNLTLFEIKRNEEYENQQ